MVQKPRHDATTQTDHQNAFGWMPRQCQTDHRNTGVFVFEMCRIAEFDHTLSAATTLELERAKTLRIVINDDVAEQPLADIDIAWPLHAGAQPQRQQYGAKET